jgi:biotin carboxyl carrier protein
MVYEVTITGLDGVAHALRVESPASGLWSVNGTIVNVETVELDALSRSLISENVSYEVRSEVQAGEEIIVVNGNRHVAEVRDPRSLRGRRDAATSGDGPKKSNAPMPGKVVRILQAVGSQVALGQGVIVIEAMKMQNELKSPKSGTVMKINFKEGDTVNAGETLVVVE